MELPMDVALAIKSNLAVIITLNAQIDLLEKRLQEKVGERMEYALLTSAPGIGQILVTIILLETGPIDRFAAVGNYAHRFCAEAKRFYERKEAKTNTAVATRVLAHKLARACYHMLKEQKPFDVTRCFA